MLSYFLKCRKNTESTNPRVSKTRNGKTMISSKCATCSSKKSKLANCSNIGKYFVLNAIPLSVQNNVILLSKVWRKYKKH